MKAMMCLFIVLTFLPCLVWAESPNTKIMGIVLTDFASRKDTSPYHSDGIILIDRETGVWDEEHLRDEEINRPNSACAVSADLRAQFAIINFKKKPAASLIVHSPKWRLLKSETEEKNSRDLVYDRTPSGQKIRTVVTLSYPAYSSTGDTAFVLLSFAWSRHGALAKYLLKNSNSKWGVQCSELIFYF